MNTYFIEKQQVNDGQIVIDGDLYHHLAKVLRCKVGASIHFSDGEEKTYFGTVVEITKNQITVSVDEVWGITGEPAIDVALIQCLPRGDKMEQIIQKSVELGVSSIYPVESENSQVRLKNKGEEKVKRWQKIAQSAAEQCGRGKIPKVALSGAFMDILDELSGRSLLFCYEKEGNHSLKTELQKVRNKKLAVIIGPEGGFSEKEAALIVEKGGVAVTMGPRILRTETAGPAVIAAVMYELGDWGCLVEN